MQENLFHAVVKRGKCHRQVPKKKRVTYKVLATVLRIKEKEWKNRKGKKPVFTQIKAVNFL